MTAAWARISKIKTVPVLYLLLLLWTLMSLCYYVGGAIALQQEFFHPQSYVRDPVGFGDDGKTLTYLQQEAKDAGLAIGDTVQSLNGKPYTGNFQENNLLRRTKPGQYLDVDVKTSDGHTKKARIQLAAQGGPHFTLGGYIAYLAPVLGVPLLGILVGFWVVAARPRDWNAWLVLALLSFVETAFGDLDWSFWPGAWSAVFWFWNTFLQIPGLLVLLLLGIYFPERWRLYRRWPWLKWLIIALAIYEFGLGFLFSTIQMFAVGSMSAIVHLKFWADRIDHILAVIYILVFLIAIFDKLRSASTQDARRRLRVLAIGSGLSLGPLLIMFGILPYLGYDFHRGRLFERVIPFVALFPLTLAYVVIVQRAMDVRILLRMGTKYLLARITIIVLEIAVAAFLVRRFVLPMMQRREHPVLNAVLLAAIVIILFRAFAVRDSISGRMQGWLDRKFFREAYNSEVVLSELAEHARKFTDKEPLIETVTRRISEVLHVPQIAVWLRGSSTFHFQQAIGAMAIPESVVFTEQSAAVQSLAQANRPLTIYRDRPEDWFVNASSAEKELLGRVGAELLLPLPGRERLIGLMAPRPQEIRRALYANRSTRLAVPCNANRTCP